MLRAIIRIDDASMPVHVGGSVKTEYRTFDVDLPEIEKLMRQAQHPQNCMQVQCVGIELLQNTPTSEAAG